MNAACAMLLLFVMAEAVTEAEAEAAAEARGSHWRAWSSLRFSPSKPLQIMNLSLRSQFGEASKNNKSFRFLAK